MPSFAERMLVISDHPAARKIADHVASGMKYGEIIKQFNVSPEMESKIHEYKSRIESDLRSGHPFEQVINRYFSNPKTRSIIMGYYHKHNSHFPR